MIPQHVKSAVMARLRADLDEYWNSAFAEVPPPQDAGEVLKDAVEYLSDKYKEKTEEKPATIAEVDKALKAYADGVLTKWNRHGQQQQRPFDGASDARQVQMALALRGLQVSTTAIIERALRLGLC